MVYLKQNQHLGIVETNGFNQRLDYLTPYGIQKNKRIYSYFPIVGNRI